MTRRRLTREQALRRNPDWSFADLRTVEQNLDRLRVRTFYVTPSESYVGCLDSSGRLVMTMHYGYLEFTRGNAPADLPDPDSPWLELSTFRPRTRPTAATDEIAQFCPTHNIALPRTGICDECQ